MVIGILDQHTDGVFRCRLFGARNQTSRLILDIYSIESNVAVDGKIAEIPSRESVTHRS